MQRGSVSRRMPLHPTLRCSCRIRSTGRWTPPLPYPNTPPLQDLFEGSTGCHTWDAGFLLAEYVMSNPDEFRGALMLIEAAVHTPSPEYCTQ